MEEQRHGPSHWKFNSNLTEDEEFEDVNIFKEECDYVLEQVLE